MNNDNIDYYRDQLEEAALQYARLKTLGYYCEKRVDGGTDVVRPCHSDIADLTNMFYKKIGLRAEDLLREMTRGDLPKREKEK